MKKTYFVLGGVSAIALLILGLSVADATNTDNLLSNRGTQRGMMHHNNEQFDENTWNEHHEEMEQVIETGDFNTWKSTMEEHMNEMGRDEMPPVVEKVTADNFDQFKQMHEFMENGDIEKADEIAEELGLGRMHGKMRGQKGHMRHMRQMMDDMHDEDSN